MGGGAWPSLVGGVICLVYSDNGRDASVIIGARKRLAVYVVSFNGHDASSIGKFCAMTGL